MQILSIIFFIIQLEARIIPLLSEARDSVGTFFRAEKEFIKQLRIKMGRS